jgi:DNA-binding NarL/FixJ family response regulator
MTTDQETQIRTLLVDDHRVVALGLKALIEEDELVCVEGIAATVAEAKAMAAALLPDVVLVDFRLPDGSGLEVISHLRSVTPTIGIVMITGSADRRILASALDAGCNGFLSKGADQEDLLAAIRAARHGESHFTPDVVRHLSHLKRFEQFDNEALTTRECEILQLCAAGRSPDEIAAELYLSTHTVRNHIRNAMNKLQAHSKLEAVVKAVRLRLISIDD